MAKHFSKKDSLLELIIENQKVKLNKLINLLKNDNFNYKQILNENIIDKDSVMNYINTQLKIKEAIDKNIETLRNLNETQKWERFLTFENLGEILLRKKTLKIKQLIEVLEEKDKYPEISLEELLLKKTLVTKRDIYDALEYQINTQQVAEKSYMEIISNYE